MPFIDMGMECPYCGRTNSVRLGNPDIATKDEDSFMVIKVKEGHPPKLLFRCKSCKNNRSFLFPARVENT